MTDLPDTLAILVEIDEVYRPADNIAIDDETDAAYVARFASGELEAYGVSVVPLDEMGDVEARIYRDGSCGPVRLASLWACEAPSGLAGLYRTLPEVPEDLRCLAEEILPEAL